MVIAPSFPRGGPLSSAGFLIGFNNLFKSLISNKKFVKKILELQTNWIGELGKICIDEGIEIFILAEDLGDNHGPFMSPKIFRDIVKPYLRKLTETLKKGGAKILLHCDGNINSIMDDIVDIGVDGYHPMERKGLKNMAAIL